MVRLLFVSVLCTILFISVIADKEYAEHGHHHHHHHHDHDGHDHHDHASHKKLFAGNDASDDDAEQRQKLRDISNRIDSDKNGRVDRNEMRVYIEKRIREQYVREADDFIAVLDPEKTLKITFEAYVRDNFGDLDIKELEKKDKSDSRTRETRRTYTADKEKWAHLDKNKDNVLNYDEFRKFLRPEDDEDLRRIEITSIINEYDENNDGKISNSEYLKMTEAETGQADSLSEELDTNKDGFGDFDEFSRYYLPTSVSTIEEEAEHLLNECDKDQNGSCTPDEIVNAYSSFAGSQITDFGADLETNREEL